jgi:hypothetical protein
MSKQTKDHILDALLAAAIVLGLAFVSGALGLLLDGPV